MSTQVKSDREIRVGRRRLEYDWYSKADYEMVFGDVATNGLGHAAGMKEGGKEGIAVFVKPPSVVPTARVCVCGISSFSH